MRRWPILGTLLAVLLCLPSAIVAETYKWTDENGKIHYSDTPPVGRSANRIKIKINSISGPPVVSTLEGASSDAGAHRVKLYTTSWCGYCRKAKAYLQSRKIAYEELDVENSAQGKRDFDALRGHGVPIILVGNQRMDGYRESKLEGMLKAAGL